MESGGRGGGMLSVTWISLSLLGELIGQFHKDGIWSKIIQLDGSSFKMLSIILLYHVPNALMLKYLFKFFLKTCEYFNPCGY